MATEVETTGYVRKGVLTIRNAEWFGALADGEVTVTVRKAYATRSPKQNRYYWGTVIRALAQHTGYTPLEMHEILKARFLPMVVEVVNARGEIAAEFQIGGSTRKLDTAQFSEYVNLVQSWAASLGVHIPDAERTPASNG